MADFIPLQIDQHRHHGWRPAGDYQFAAQQQLTPISADELDALVPLYPLAFAKEGDQFRMGALLGWQAGHNAYVTASGRWLAPYKPAFIRLYPFRQMVMPGQEGHVEQRSLLAIEAGHLGRADEDGVRALFDAQGNPNDELTSIMTFAQRVEQGRAQLQHAVDKLAELDLIVPWPVKVANEDSGATQALDGLYQIDERALLGLDGDALQSLSAVGALSVAYGQLYSRRQFQMFGRLARIKARLAELPADADDGPMSLDELFDEGDDEFNFDFDS